MIISTALEKNTTQRVSSSHPTYSFSVCNLLQGDRELTMLSDYLVKSKDRRDDRSLRHQLHVTFHARAGIRSLRLVMLPCGRIRQEAY